MRFVIPKLQKLVTKSEKLEGNGVANCGKRWWYFFVGGGSQNYILIKCVFLLANNWVFKNILYDLFIYLLGGHRKFVRVG